MTAPVIHLDNIDLTLGSGASAVHVEHWGILDGLERPSTDAAFAELATAVAAWLGKF